MNYTLSDIAKICHARLVGTDMAVETIVTDSRSFAADASALFVAMHGVNHDAHDYIEDMVERGIRAFMVEREVELPEGCGAVVVANALTALQELATHHRTHYHGTVVGITGSNGKTTIKEWIAQTAPRNAKLYRSPRSYNSQLGVALSLLMLDESSDTAIIEAGISQRGEMERLYKMIRPDVVIFSSIGDAHQEGFGSFEEKMDEKLILATTPADIIYHSDYAELASLIEKRFANRNLIDASAKQAGNFTDIASKRNAAIVASFAELMGHPTPDFSTITPLAMRLEVKQGVEDSLIINDSYSADLDSLAIALDALRSIAGDRKRVVILSDILQSGLNELELYGRIAALVAKADIDRLIGIGEAFSHSAVLFGEKFIHYASVEQALGNIGPADIAGCAVLIKGNRQSRVERISHRLELRSHTTILEVNLQAMARNISYFRKMLNPDVALMAMVKASGYGAGDTEVAQLLQKQGVKYLAVAFADEGVLLRNEGITMPIVVLNADDASFDTMVAHHLEPEIYSLRSLEAFARCVESSGAGRYPIHLKIDSGMHRLGFENGQLDELCASLDRLNGSVRVASIFTHLCVADDASQDDFTRHQINCFDRISRHIAEHLSYKVLRHAAASAAIVRFPEAQFDMCRLGLGMYGFGYTHNDALEPVSTLRTRIVQIRSLDEGATVGYGCNGKIMRPSRIATIPVGYADGLNRRLGNGAWSMVVGGCKTPTVGNICMDSCMIDITGIDGIEEGDEVTIFSALRGNTAEDMAAVLGTIPYEVLTSVSKRVKRIYVEE